MFIKSILFVLFGVLYLNLNAQTEELLTPIDSIMDAGTIVDVDTVMDADTLVLGNEVPQKEHLPRIATIYSAIVPGLGQIYNKQAWKVPLVYGGFVGFGLVVNFYAKNYLEYKNAYYDLTDGNTATNSYTLYEGLLYTGEIDESSPDATITTYLYDAIADAKKKRDQFIIYTAAFYLFNILDANVSAHLIDFDISEELSLNLEPIAIDPLTNTPILGATFSYNF